jgi:hypothetical protein
MPRPPHNVTTNLNVVTPISMHQRLHEIAAQQDRSVSSLLRGIIGAYLEKHRRTAAAKGEPAKAVQIS